MSDSFSKFLTESANIARAEVQPLKDKLSAYDERVLVMEKSFKDINDLSATVNSLVDKTQETTEGIQKLIDEISKPFWKDKRFWAGIIAIPALILSGWLVKAFWNDAALLKIIHKGFGTEPALIHTLNESKNSDFKSAVASVVYGAGRVMHSQVASIGLVEPSRIDTFRCVDKIPGPYQDMNKICINFEEASRSTATSDFHALGLEKINIRIGLHISTIKIEIDDKSGDISNVSAESSKEDPLKKITVLLDGMLIPLKDLAGGNIDYKLDDSTYSMRFYDSCGFKIQSSGFKNVFPVYTLEFAGSESMKVDEDYILAFVLVERTNEAGDCFNF